MAGFDWTDLITPGFQLGGSLLGNKMQTDASKYGVKENARQFDINTQRQDQARNMLLPNLQTTLGQTPGGPGFAGGYQAYSPEAQGGGGGGLGGTLAKTALGIGGPIAAAKIAAGLGAKTAPGIINYATVSGGSGGAGGLGALGAKIGAGAGKLGGMMAGLASNPLTWAAAAGLGGVIAAKQIGRGRKAANKLTGSQGAQGQFSGLMEEIARRQADGRMSPEQAKMALSQGLDRSIQSGLGAMGSGDKKNNQKVMRQWLGDFSNQAWMRDHPELNPIAQRYLGSIG